MLTTKMSSAIWTHLSTYTHKSATLFKVSAKNGTGVAEIKKSTGRQDYFIFRTFGSRQIDSYQFHTAGHRSQDRRNFFLPQQRNAYYYFSEMFPVEGDGYIIDTPGIKGFGTFDMEEEEIGHYFPEIFKVSADCRYGNCTHRHEPGCAVREAVEKHYISESRYASYLNMLEDKEEGKYRAAY